jgi:hypothetical protein
MLEELAGGKEFFYGGLGNRNQIKGLINSLTKKWIFIILKKHRSYER